MDQQTIAAERAQLIAEALSWRGTPYIPCCRVKGMGGGADCLTFIAGAFEGAGLIPAPEIPLYSPQWHMHQNDELYLNGVGQYCVEVGQLSERTPLPGDIIVFRFGRTYSHGAIVVAWPELIHAYVHQPCGRVNYEQYPPLQFIGENVEGKGKPRPYKIFTLKRWIE